jgi:hypothetical protein
LAEFSYPSPAFNNGNVDEVYYERLSISSVADGLVGLPTDSALVFAGTGLQIRFRANARGLVRGFMWEAGTTDVNVSVTPNSSGSTRTDLAVLRLDRSTWTVRTAIRQGTPGAGAPSPVQTETGVWELPVAEYPVANGASAPGTITPRAWWIDDGRILAKPAALPPHYPGRQVLEWNTTTGVKRQLVSDGGAWIVLWEDTGAQAMSLVAGWSASVNMVRRHSGLAVMHLTARRHPGGTLAPSGGAYADVATIPAGYRPPATLEVPVYATGPQESTSATITPAGTVSIRRDVELTFGTFFILAPAMWIV